MFPKLPHSLTRRSFCLTTAVASLPALAWGQTPAKLITSITKETVRRGRDGSGPTWFHPRCCVVPGEPNKVLMTMQTIHASDSFGPVQWSESADGGRKWTDPQPIPALGFLPEAENVTAGVCDVVPEYHAPTKTVIAMGHTVFYRGGKFFTDQPRRKPVYAIRNANGEWSDRQLLEWDDPRATHIHSNNCGQRVVLPNGEILMSFTFGSKTAPRMVCGVICSYDGKTLAVRKTGPALENKRGRGLLEPSLTTWKGKFYLTIRAEDERGYVTQSDDGLNYEKIQPWSWDDGTPLSMSTTQQHWLTHSERLFLVYTRKDAANINVIRWRSPLYLAEVDPQTLRLRRDTEQIVLPLVGDGVNDAKRVAIMGNFHPVNVTPNESWVTVGEWQPQNGIRGDMLLSRIQWGKENALVKR